MKLITTKEAALLLGRPASTLERWRCEGRGPEFVKVVGGVRYDEARILDLIREHTHKPSVRANMEEKRGAV